MKAFKDLQKSLFIMKKLYLSVPKFERLKFLNNFLETPLFLEIKDHVSRMDHSVTGANDNFDKKFFNPYDIEYTNLLEDQDNIINVGVFFIPKGLYLPTHDHPNMIVISKIMAGSINIVSFDEIKRINGIKEIEVKITQNEFLNKDDINILKPNDRNYHCIMATENTIFLDVFFPHYDEKERICNYYDYLIKDNKHFLKINNQL